MRELIAEYFEDYYPPRDIDWFNLVKSKKSVVETIEAAVLSLNYNGKMHSHQCRVGHIKLRNFANGILSTKGVIRGIKEAIKTKDFHELYTILLRESHKYPRISKLTIYDTAQRIGEKYGIQPKYVYLHAGVKAGAKRLGLNTRKKQYLTMDELPLAITTKMEAWQVENFLCIFNDRFSSTNTQRKVRSC